MSAVPESAATAPLRPRRWRGMLRPTFSTRARILGGFVLFMAIALVLGLFVQRLVLRAQLNSDVNAELAQEVDELQRLSTGRDPETGQPFGTDIAAIFDTFLRRNIPVEGEALFTLIDGRPYASTSTPLQLFEYPEITSEWAAIESATRKEISTEAGPVRYLAIPVHTEGQTSGTFIVAIFLKERQDRIDRVIREGATVFGSIFIIGSVLSWFAAGRVLRPVRLVTSTARKITESNWSERIPAEGEDEIAELARTFNEMLDRLEASFQTQRDFIDDAGHELRTPVTIIRGHLELLGDDPGEREETMRLVMDELDRMTRIVEDLLLLARSEHPDFLQQLPFDAAEFTHEVAAKAAALGNRQWAVAEAPHVVLNADRQRLTQALMNIARNAVEHSADGSRITFGCRTVGSDIHFWVQDEGEGIAAQDLQHIFERFSRAGKGHRKAQGAGLGLAIANAIVTAHGGRIIVDSAPGRGSTFTIALPLAGATEP